MSLRPRLLASTSLLISSLCAGASAQTAASRVAQSPSPPADAGPAAGTPASAPSTAGEGQPATAPDSGQAPAGTGTQLPTIRVNAPKTKPVRGKPPRNATPAPPTTRPPAPTPYETGAPNVAGGTPAVPQLASQTTISGAELNSRPVATNTEILEAAPGLAVVQHSGSGKANQYYLRGYNLDHGTDLAIFWDDVPINLPTNAHGQGYADLNFLIPETLGGLEVRKGPYFADVGDFANAGDLHLFLRDSVPRTSSPRQSAASATTGS